MSPPSTARGATDGFLIRRSLLNRLFVVLVLFVLAPVIVMYVLSNRFIMGVIHDEIGKTSMEKLQVAANLIEMIDADIEATCTRIALDPRLTELAETHRFDEIRADNDVLYDFYQYAVFLDNQVRTNVTFHSIHIQIEGTDYIVSSVDGTTLRQDFSDAAWLNAQPPPDRGRDGAYYVGPHVPGSVAWRSQASDLDSKEQVISYMYPLSSYITELRGLIVLNIREAEYSRLINSSTVTDEGSISIMDQFGVVMTHVDSSLVGTSFVRDDFYQRIVGSDQTIGYFIEERPEADHMISWFRPDPNGWLLVGDFSLAGVRNRVANVRLVSLLSTLAIVMLGVAISRIVSARLSSPLKKLLRQVESRRGSENESSSNELALLQSAFDTLIRREKQWFSSQLHESQSRTELWVRHAIHGVSRPGDEQPAKLTGSRMLVSILAIDGYSEFRLRTNAEEQSHLESIVLHMAEEVFLPALTCVGVPQEDGSIIMVMATDVRSEAALRQLLDKRFQSLLNGSRTALQTTVTLGVGLICDDRNDLPASWHSGQAQLKRRFMAGPGRWFWPYDPQPQEVTGTFPRREEREVVAALGARDIPQVDAAIDSFVRAIRDQSAMSLEQVMVILNQMVGSVLKHLLESNTRLSSYFGHDMNLYKTLAGMETLDETEEWLRAVLHRIVEGTQEEAEEHDRIRGMADFIRSNYRRDIGVEDVANHVGLSYSHARKVFREEFGDSIVDFTNSIRISEVRRLLLETAATLEDIAVQVGYNNAQSLNRHFKKITGLTPGEYRAQASPVR